MIFSGKATGGGAYKYADLFKERLGVSLEKEDEMDCLVAGSNFLLKVLFLNWQYPYLGCMPQCSSMLYMVFTMDSSKCIMSLSTSSHRVVTLRYLNYVVVMKTSFFARLYAMKLLHTWMAKKNTCKLIRMICFPTF
jgi:hypothetical protein